ncbi:hypothetical protein [Herbidospora sp. NBRC 101105]|uniref:hypothetical protein n=1 Tax=Herbidospora sp. NBRC 101105 TaxID=3032195 RepID=UPI002555A7E9|nr:hypothetical protein [Herbidospora sp. NBRC 101105]
MRVGLMMRAVPVLAPVLVMVLAGCSGAEGVARPGTVRAEISSAIYAPIEQQRVDAAPLTEQEVFPAAALGVMKKESVSLTADCGAAVAADVDGCTQVVRGLFRGPELVGQVAVFNLGDVAQADALVHRFREELFLTPLASERAGTAMVRAMGHFVAVSWVSAEGDAKPDLAEPLAALDQASRFVQARILAL